MAAEPQQIPLAEPQQAPSIPMSLAVVRGVDPSGVVVEVRPPRDAQDAVDMRARAREVADALNGFARWLDDESVTLMKRDGQTLVIGPGGRTYGLGQDNIYPQIVEPAACRAELLIAASSPQLEGAARITAMIEDAFEYVDPPPPKPFWRYKNVPLTKVEGLGGAFAAIVLKHRGKVTPREVLKEKK